MNDQPLDSGDEDATALEPEELLQLIPSYITTRAQLNEAEQINIATADIWAFERRRDVLSEKFLLELHEHMLGRVWRWAGSFRSTERNIGIAPHQIRTELRKLLDDGRYWIDNDTYESDEIAVRFHHRLVWIHPFSNGNGRHARMAADLLAVALGRPRFTWGRSSLVEVTETRNRYIAALRAADGHEIGPLLAFARS